MSNGCYQKWLFHLFLWIIVNLKIYGQKELCRSKLGTFIKNDFYTHTCAWCYFFLYPEYDLKPNEYHLVTNGSDNQQTLKVLADTTNQSSVNIICSFLTFDECQRWTLCCSAARACCLRQLQSRDNDGNSTCPATWDGFGCWTTGNPGQTSHISCPNFLRYSIPTRSASKMCQKDGTWLRKGGHDWTDYTLCLNYQALKVSIYISIGCQAASILCLLPSIFIFLKYNSLLNQHRIRLHLNFFISLILSGVGTILWNIAVTYDKITNSSVSDTLLYKNSIECKALSYLKLYFTSTNYVWMFCEGLYLHRLIVNAFFPPERLMPFYIFGWGFPLLYTSAYAVMRIIAADESGISDSTCYFTSIWSHWDENLNVHNTRFLHSLYRLKVILQRNCWSKSAEGKEWIIYAPNLFCLLANVYFLCCILRILLTQLQVHPNEPSNFRKALKATFMLIPLFGVQLVVTVYRLPPESSGSLHYERFSDFVINSQGLFVALIFCLCNGEVISVIKFSRRRNRLHNGTKRAMSCTSLNMNNYLTSPYQTIHNRTSPYRCLLSLKRKEHYNINNTAI